MPDYYAHLQYGSRVLSHLPAELQSRIDSELSAFECGCYGPDPMFFGPGSAYRRAATEAHHGPAAAGLERLRASVKAGAPYAWGYAAGYICHYVLDRTFHTYVLRNLTPTLTHTAMEAEFDSYLMRLDGREEVGHRTYMPHWDMDRLIAQAAARTYPDVTPQMYIRSMKQFWRLTWFLTFCGGRPARWLTEGISRLIPPARRIRGTVPREEPGGEARRTNADLLAILEASVPVGVEAVLSFFRAVRGGLPLGDFFYEQDFHGSQLASVL